MGLVDLEHLRASVAGKVVGPDEATRRSAAEWIDGTRKLIAPALAGSAALGFVGDGERALAAVPNGYCDEHRARLDVLKRQFDPDDRFRFDIGGAFRA